MEVKEQTGEEQTDGNWKVGRFMKKRLKGVGKKVVGAKRTLKLWTKKKKTGDPSKGEQTLLHNSHALTQSQVTGSPSLIISSE